MGAAPLYQREEVLRVAEEAAQAFAPDCLRIEVGGSVRRGLLAAKDVELVLIPRRIVLEENVLGEVLREGSAVRARIPQLVEQGTVAARLDKNGRQSMGDVTQKLLWRGVPLDLFAATPDNFGLKLAIYTGPWCFSKWLVTKRQFGGAMPSDMYMKDFKLWRVDGAGEHHEVKTPEERDVFEALRLDYIEPGRRDSYLEGLVANGWKCDKK